MNSSDPTQDITEQDSQGKNEYRNEPSDANVPDAVDQYMHRVGGVLYDIILDWLKQQEEGKGAQHEHQ